MLINNRLVTLRSALLELLFFMFSFVSVIYNSNYMSTNRGLTYDLAYLRLFIACICLILASDKILNSGINSLLVLIPIILVGLSFLKIGFNELIFAFLIFPIVNVLGIKKLLKIDFIARTSSFFIVVIFLRIVKTSTFFYGNGQAKPSLGFSNPNTLGEVALVIACELFILQKQLNKYLFFFMNFILLIIIIISGARTAIYMYVLFICIQKLVETKFVFKNRFSMKRCLFAGIPLYLLLFSQFLVEQYVYHRSNFLIKLDYFLSGRIHNAAEYYLNFPPALFPTKLNLEGFTNIGPLDPGYINLLEKNGLIITSLFIMFLCATLFFLSQKKYSTFISSFLIFIIIGLSESTFYEISINIFLLYFAVLLQNTKYN